jgi:hypothetical protein
LNFGSGATPDTNVRHLALGFPFDERAQQCLGEEHLEKQLPGCEHERRWKSPGVKEALALCPAEHQLVKQGQRCSEEIPEQDQPEVERHVGDQRIPHPSLNLVPHRLGRNSAQTDYFGMALPVRQQVKCINTCGVAVWSDSRFAGETKQTNLKVGQA